MPCPKRRSIPDPAIRPTGRSWLAVLSLILLAPALVRAAEFNHEMLLCVSMAKNFVIGAKIQNLSGLYRSADRTTPQHVGFNHPRLDMVAWDPRLDGTLYTVGLNGVLRSSDDGKSWRIMTSWDMTEPKYIAVDPNAPDHVYIGLPDGIGVSRDRGQTWTRMDEGIRRKYTQTIVVDRTRPGRLIAGTELGIYLSTDGAKRWKLRRRSTATVTEIKQSPHDPAVFLASTQADGAWMSRDGGKTWQTLEDAPGNFTLHNCDFDARDPQRLILSGWGCGVVLSEDGGQTWTERNEGLPNKNVWRVAIDPDLPGRLYASPHQAAIYASDDYGRSWHPLWFEEATVWSFAFKPRKQQPEQ